MSKLIFKITNDKYKDDIIVSGETIDEVGENTRKELKKRNWKREDCLSQQLEL